MTIPGQWHNDAFSAKKLNETEIVEFALGEHVCGVDVAQVREIIRTASGIVRVGAPHPSIIGVVNLRGKIIPVIDLAKYFHLAEGGDLAKNRVIISEFYRFRVGFLVHQVTRILRVSRPIIESPAQSPQPWGNYLKGIVHNEGRTVPLLDIEQIALDVHPVERGQAQERAAFPPLGQRSLPCREPLAAGEEPLAIPKVDFDRSTKHILVVEDSAFMRQLIARYLKQSGYNVLTVSNGHEAWEVLEDVVRAADFKDIARHYQLILTDIEMPRMDGLELIQKVKGHPAFKKLPCIVFSGSLIDDLAAKCQAAGADVLLSKDDIELLVRSIDSKVLR